MAGFAIRRGVGALLGPQRTGVLSPSIPDLVGWVLRTNRLFTPSVDFSKAESFASAFNGGVWHGVASVSKISRWETAVTPPTHGAVRRYEELLEAPPNNLVSTIDTVYRYGSPPQCGVPMLRRVFRDDEAALLRLEDLLDRVLSSAVVSGDYWDELTGLLSAMPKVVLVPRSAWETIANRLITEMILSSGRAWLARFEALNRLLVHPRGQMAAIAACASLARDTGNQVFIEVVGALDGTGHPDASRHVLAQLRNPTNDRSRFGALLACVRKVRYHHFDDAQLAALVPIELELLGDPAAHMDARDLAVELLQQAPPATREHIRRKLRAVLGGDQELNAVLRGGRLAEPESARIVTQRIAATARASVVRDVAGYEDNIVPYVISDMLYHPVFDVRLYAAFMLGVTPYRDAVAAALTAEISGAAVLCDPTLTRSILGALRVLGGPEQRRLVETLVTATGLPGSIAVTAAQTIGHVGGQTDDETWRRMLYGLAGDAQHGQDPARAAALDAVVYGVGIMHVETILQMIKSDPSLPARARIAATWWLDVPKHIRESALDRANA